MNLIITFSGRTAGNCNAVANYIKRDADVIADFGTLSIHSCSQCRYECFNGVCKYRDDGIYGLYDRFRNYEKIILIVPMYCGNPSSLYFIFNERSQDFFTHNPEVYAELVRKMYFIGIYGSSEETPDFLRVFEKWFDCGEKEGHILGIERHKHNQKMEQCIIECEAVKQNLDRFMDEIVNRH